MCSDRCEDDLTSTPQRVERDREVGVAEDLQLLSAHVAGDEGGRGRRRLADVGDAVAVERLIAAAVERFGRLDILINNAATMPPCGRNRRSTK